MGSSQDDLTVPQAVCIKHQAEPGLMINFAGANGMTPKSLIALN